MRTLHHILISRTLGMVSFALFLVLTPRAWVEPDSHGATQEVPVQALEQPSDCLWCEPAPTTKCDEGHAEAPQSARPWLNPDEVVVPLEAPCPDDQTSPHS